jgi:hypothetical protein
MGPNGCYKIVQARVTVPTEARTSRPFKSCHDPIESGGNTNSQPDVDRKIIDKRIWYIVV